MSPINKRTLITTAAAVFAAGTFVTAAHAQGVRCAGINTCKGQTACKTAENACKGQNECKGHGWLETTAADCKAKGGRPVSDR